MLYRMDHLKGQLARNDASRLQGSESELAVRDHLPVKNNVILEIVLTYELRFELEFGAKVERVDIRYSLRKAVWWNIFTVP
jgi:hypothetical protein